MADRRKVTDTQSRRVGSRWYGERPEGDDVAEWFGSVHLDEGMNHADHVGGITLISSTETVPGVDSGELVDVERNVHVPYVGVQARLDYFWQLCELRSWLGEIEQVPTPRLEAEGYYNLHLPPGFARMPVKLIDGKVVSYVICTQRVRIYERSVRSGEKGRLVRLPSSATKQVPLLNRWGKPDNDALAKAETGSQGRALGMAGIFVLPGSGVATAEDMTDFLAQQQTVAEETLPELPEKPRRELIADLAERLQEHRERWAAFEAWLHEKKINFGELRESQERSVLAKLESLDEPE